MSGVKAALHSQHFEASVFRAHVGISKLLEAGVHVQRNPDLASFLVDDLEDFEDDGLPDLLDLRNKMRIVFKQLLCFLVEVLLLEFLILLEHLRILMDLELAPQIEKEALQDIEGVIVEIINHHRVVLGTSLYVLPHHLVTV